VPRDIRPAGVDAAPEIDPGFVATSSIEDHEVIALYESESRDATAGVDVGEGAAVVPAPTLRPAEG
jgi:hypothetical protein